MTQLQRPKSLTELVTEALRSEIVDGALPLGAALSEVGISKRLGVSRTPVREAFSRLDIEGLVRTEPQRGTFVFTLSDAELRDICDVRVCLETAALRMAYSKNRDAISRALSDVVEKMSECRKANDDAGYLRLDTAFHQTFFDHAGNAFLNDAYQTIAYKMAALRHRLGRHQDHMAKSFDEHTRLNDLIRNGQIDDAESLLIKHIGRKEGSYWELVSDLDSSPGLMSG